MNNSNFKSSKNEFKELLTSNGKMEEVFQLLCPMREHDWIPSWQADIIWSESGFGEEGAIFITGPETWIITDYVSNKKVYFVRYNPDIVTRLKIDVKEENGKIAMIWTQSQTGTTEAGNAKVESATEEGFSGMVKSLEFMMDYYIETGSMIPAHTLSERLSKSRH